MKPSSRFVMVRVSPTIACEYESRCPDDIPDYVSGAGRFAVETEHAKAMLADAEFNGDRRNGPDERPPHIGRAYRALAEQIRKALQQAAEQVGRAQPKVKAGGWIGHKGCFGRNHRWTHPQLPGIVVQHCGHPTALRPYYIPGHRGTYPRLRDAQEAAKRLADSAAAE